MMKYSKILSSFLFLSISLFLSIYCFPLFAQNEDGISTVAFKRFGIIADVVFAILLLLSFVIGMWICVIKVTVKAKYKRKEKELKAIQKELLDLEGKELDEMLEKRREALLFKLKGNELAGEDVPVDKKGIVSQASSKLEIPFVSEKKYLREAINVDPGLRKLIMAFIGMSVFWIVFGTSVGEYLGIKFVAPDADHVAWLSFGRLRPGHTNTVFW